MPPLSHLTEGYCDFVLYRKRAVLGGEGEAEAVLSCQRRPVCFLIPPGVG